MQCSRTQHMIHLQLQCIDLLLPLVLLPLGLGARGAGIAPNRLPSYFILYTLY